MSATFPTVSNITSCVRARAFSKEENSLESCCVVQMPNTQRCRIVDPKTRERSSFSADQVFWSAGKTKESWKTSFARQQDIYNYVGPKLIASTQSNKTTSLYSYGAERTGKTYSLLGDLRSIESQHCGLVPRMLSELLDISSGNIAADHQTRTAEESKDFFYELLRDSSISLSYIHIFGSEARDLLSKDGGVVRIRDHPKRGSQCASTKVVITSTTQALAVLQNAELLRAQQERRVDSSMCSLLLSIMIHEKKHLINVSSPISLPLPPSQIRRINFIKVSSHCADLKVSLQKLAANQPPPQDSNEILVKLLQDGFRLEGLTLLLVNISPTDRDYHHSVDSLNFMKLLRSNARRSRKQEKQEQHCEQCVNLELKHRQEMATLERKHKLATQVIKAQEAQKIAEHVAEVERRLHSQRDLLLEENVDLAKRLAVFLEPELSTFDQEELECRSATADKDRKAGNCGREEGQEEGAGQEEEKNQVYIDENQEEDDDIAEEIEDIDEFLKKMDSLVNHMESSFNDFVHLKEDEDPRDIEIIKLRAQVSKLESKKGIDST